MGKSLSLPLPTTTTTTTAATAATPASANFANETAHNQHFVGRGQEFEKLFFVNEADGTLLWNYFVL